MSKLAERLRKSTALTALTLSPTGYAAAQQSAGAQQQASVVTDHPADKSLFPDAPKPAIVIPASSAAPGQRGFFERATEIAHDIDKVEDEIHLRPHIDRYKVELDAPLRQDKEYSEPDSSLNMVGLTSGAPQGVRGNWTAGLFAEQTLGSGALNPAEKTRSYGGKIETHITGRKGPVSVQGQIRATGGEERFKPFMTQSEMDAQLAAQGVPPGFYSQGEAAIEASLPTTNQPLIAGRASGDVELDPKFTYVKKGAFKAGLTGIEAGGDIQYGSLGHGREKEICGTGFNVGDSVAVSACEESGVAGGHDNPRAPNGLHINIAIDTSRLGRDVKEILGHHTARTAVTAEKESKRDNGK